MRWSSLLYFFSREGECTNNNKFTRDYDDLYTRSQFLAASSWSAGALRGSSERCELCARWELCVRCVRALYTFLTRGEDCTNNHNLYVGGGYSYVRP